MATQSVGITTNLFAREVPTEDRPEEDDERDDTLEVPRDKEGHPAHPAIVFQHHAQRDKQAVVRGLPDRLATNPLRSRRRSK